MSSEERVRFIFTYGTLMSSADGDMGAKERALLGVFAQLCGRAKVRGRMYDAGACPAAILGGGVNDVVHGEIWHLPKHLSEVIHVLDLYEGCAPACPLPHPYARRRIRVRTPNGQRVTAWMYAWVKPVDGLRHIADGRWRGPVRQPELMTLREAVAA